MGIVGDILFFPFKGIFFIFEEIHEATLKALKEDAEQITENLRNLHFMLEKGEITEAEFDNRETKLLDRLDQINLQLNGPQEEMSSNDDDDEDESEEDDDDESEEDDDNDHNENQHPKDK